MSQLFTFEDRELDGRPTSAPRASATYFKNSPNLQRVPLQPARPISIDRQWPSARRMIASTYNRLGGLMQAVASEAGSEVAAVLAVWHVESGGRTHTVNRAIIRFENHLLYRRWGARNESTYRQYFRHGGHAGEPGKSWENHKFRENAAEPFRAFHGSQDLEYRVLAVARRLAGEEAALQCISIGGPQIVVSNYRLIGYSTPGEMYRAFQAGERAHVLGFFDFCRHKSAPRAGALLLYLQNRQWDNFARYYNGPGQVSTYGGRIQNAYEHAQQLLMAQ
jgi:hypothetical protein